MQADRKAVDALRRSARSPLAVNVVDVEAVYFGVRLFNDHRPPPVLVAVLGDLAGATGASLLSPSAPAPAG